MTRLWTMFGALAVALAVVTTGLAADAGLKEAGKPDLKSAGPIAFGPPGVLFVADPQGAAIFAIGVDAPAKSEVKAVKVEGIDAKVAAALGTKAGDILINDLAVQPGTGNVFLSVSRGKGPDAEAVIGEVSIIRDEYLAAMKTADKMDFGPLIALHEKYTES